MPDTPLITRWKSCPFCGGHNIQEMTLAPESSPTGYAAYIRNCTDCGGSTGGFPTAEDADAAWNQRVGAN